MAESLTDRVMTGRPFGDADCETEIERLQSDYSDYFFSETAFNSPALDPRTYLIVGRRGSGKTALANYFGFQNRLRDASAIDVDEPEIFEHVMLAASDRPGFSAALHVNNVAAIWDVILWSIVFRELADRHPAIARGCWFGRERGPVTKFVFSVLEGMLERCLSVDAKDLARGLREILHDPVFDAAKKAALEVAATKPVIVSVDSLEHYEIDNEEMMQATAALVQCASKFNRRYAEKGIHVKVFLSGEVYPYLVESVITNPLKFAKDPVFLVWRTKDLMRLICWRFYRFLQGADLLRAESRGTIRWRNPRDVRTKMWDPYFGRELQNRAGLPEKTFPYVLRHTHLRPRQVIVLCNHIAERARRRANFPVLERDDIICGVQTGELELANELINSYSQVYPQAGRIVDALRGLPPVFGGNQLDKIAPKTASEWPGNYSPVNFRSLIAQLGVVGRVEAKKDHYVEAAFEYSVRDRLALQSDDECAIHPMFYQRLHVQSTGEIVYPILNDDD